MVLPAKCERSSDARDGMHVSNVKCPLPIPVFRVIIDNCCGRENRCGFHLSMPRPQKAGRTARAGDAKVGRLIVLPNIN